MRLDAYFPILVSFNLSTLLVVSYLAPVVLASFEEETARLTHFLIDGWNRLLNSTQEELTEIRLESIFDLDRHDENFYGSDNWQLENKKSDEAVEQDRGELAVKKRNYFRVTNKVFSRVDLPEVYRPPKSRPGAFCLPHIGCLEEVSTLSSILRWGNVTASFIVYTSSKPKGTKIIFEPLMHYQLEDANITSAEIQDKLNRNQPSQIVSRFRTSSVHFRQAQMPVSLSRITAKSWQSAAKIKRKLELPFDLAAMELSGFNVSQNTRIIIGGYFAKEEEQWINEVIRYWQRLEPANVIKVSWADSNRGLYHSAAFNSRIVGRQMTLFLYYLDQMYGIDLDKFHLVGHSLGAHIAGFVGAENDGNLARITGLDPAGPIFADFEPFMRLDPSDAKFVDVIHTNGGLLTRGALGLATPSGHVDYYANGGAIQPGCMNTAALVDPVERVACNHRRSYRYFIEILKMTIGEMQESNRTGAQQVIPKGPAAFLFESKPSELDQLVQPDLLYIMDKNNQLDRDDSDRAPLRKQVEFHNMRPRDFPLGKTGTYFFRTQPEAPYFASRQMGLAFVTQSPLRRKIVITVKVGEAMPVHDLDLDVMSSSLMLTFVMKPTEIAAMNFSHEIPQLSISWRYKTFYLLPNQPSELHLTDLKLFDLESTSPSKTTFRYVIASQSIANGTRDADSEVRVTLHRNRWYRFDGKAFDSV